MSIVENLSKVWGKLSSTAKFAAHYADEALSIANALRSIIPALPIGSSDKKKITDTITRLETAAGNIADFLDGKNDFNPPVVVKESDVLKAVETYFAANPDKIGTIAKAAPAVDKPSTKAKA